MLSFFPLDVLDEIRDVIESVSERFLTYFLIQVHRKSKQVTVIQRETNIGQLVIFNAVSGRRRKKDILKINFVNNS